MVIRSIKKVLAASLLSVSVVSLAVVAYAQDEQPKMQDKEINIKFDSVKQYESIEKSASGIAKHIKFLNGQLDKLKENKVKDIETTITFSKPLTYEELQVYIQQYNIKPKQLVARSVNDTDRITTAFAPSASEEDITNTIESLNKSINASFVGFIDMKGQINYDSIDGLSNDPISFAIDTSGDDFLNEAEKGAYAHSLSWLLEDVSEYDFIQNYQGRLER